MADSSDRSIELDPEQASAVARAIADYRADKPSLTNGAIQRVGKASQPIVTDITTGRAKTYWRSSLRKVSLGLGWTATSIENILNGGEPTMAEDNKEDDRDALAEDVKNLRAEVADLRALILRLDKSQGGAQGDDEAR